MNNRSQSKSWCFTINNYTDKDITNCNDLICNYIVYGIETGENGTPHLQGYVYFDKKKTFKTIQDAFESKAHIERAKGSPKQASDYCKKDGDFVERGNLPGGQGQRTDLHEVYNQIKNGSDLRSIAESNPTAAIKYSTGILRLQQFFRPNRERPPTIWTFWGKTGTGKTRRVWEFANLDQLWLHPGGQWFDGYMGHKSALFDDFDGSWFKITYLLKLLDRYVFTVPIKGGFTWWAPSTIYITSNIDPREWYPMAKDEHKRALLRRLTEFGTIQEC